MRSWPYATVTLAGVIVLAACTQNYDDFVFLPINATTASSTGGGGSTTAAGGQGGGGSGGGGGGVTSSGGGGAGGTGGTAAICGDGKTNGMEECDDQNDVAADGCTECVVDCVGPGFFKNPRTAHCYIWINASDNWDAASQECASLGGGFELASLETLEEIAFVGPQALGDSWIGGRRNPSGDFIWLSGEAWTYVDETPPWGGTEPSDDGDCVELRSGTNFNDNNCNDDRDYICELYPAGR